MDFYGFFEASLPKRFFRIVRLRSFDRHGDDFGDHTVGI